ncbi:HAD-IIIC family phosphatase [Brevifollis gellanilyticus]|uniref:Methoxymalonyl-ACP biosynthesis protein FkbH n=1 Tax=Brevifollis gellanilyticus TaxID=748831 RepID=A0A512M6X4_9BACT|nr:HAD-IIIC family phosphatase [Brevifollis gellanilyticus]GEP42486.1 methoxymalonyl-ACP biosynthesis protein FkbH [Brevifollis gellanilyticus]
MTFAEAHTRLQTHLRAGHLPQAAGALRDALQEPFKFTELQQLNRTNAASEAAWRGHLSARSLRIAILGGFTTQPVREVIRAVVLAEGWWPEIYEAPYNTFETEPLDESSGVHAFAPDIVILATGSVNLHELPPPGADEALVAQMAEQVVAGCAQRWQALCRRDGVRIIQHNFETPADLPLGRLEGRLPWSATRFTREVNDRLWTHDGGAVRILDMHQLTSDCGRRHWHEPRWFHHAKHGFDPALVHHYSRALGGLLRSMLGRTRKCLVTDLDNTLWGGVIGDDGVDGIAFGSISAAGEAYAAYAHYLKRLSTLGVALAVCSKNDPAVASAVFETHSEMPLKKDEFAAFVCNWEPKSDNLRSIAKHLNLGLDSLVFVDDNPAECDEVRRALPEVTVIEMSGDSAYFPRRIEELQLFTPLDITQEDFSRTASYAALRQISTLTQTPGAGLEAHLASLEMEGSIHQATTGDLPRIEQLFRKTNQFNLTGATYTQDALAAMAAAPDCRVYAVRLKDRFAAHGIVSVLVARLVQEEWQVDNWVMSCRVFNRRLEDAILNHALADALASGCSKVAGLFRPTAKNDYARTFLARLDLLPSDSSAEVTYSVPASRPALPHSIHLI